LDAARITDVPGIPDLQTAEDPIVLAPDSCSQEETSVCKLAIVNGGSSAHADSSSANESAVNISLPRAIPANGLAEVCCSALDHELCSIGMASSSKPSIPRLSVVPSDIRTRVHPGIPVSHAAATGSVFERIVASEASICLSAAIAQSDSLHVIETRMNQLYDIRAMLLGFQDNAERLKYEEANGNKLRRHPDLAKELGVPKKDLASAMNDFVMAIRNHDVQLSREQHRELQQATTPMYQQQHAAMLG